MGEAVPGNLFRGHRTCIALIASTVHRRVAIENLSINAGPRNADAIAGAHDWSKITYANHLTAAGRRNPHEGNHVLIGIVGVDPLETRGLMIGFPQGRLGAIDAIEIADQV